MKKITIPVSKLNEGLDKSKRQIQLLIDSSELLVERRKYPTALALLVLAREEISKLNLIQQHQKDEKPITEVEWTKVTSHKSKLALPYLTAFEHLKDKPKEYMVALDQLNKKLGFSEHAFAGVVKPVSKEMLKTVEKNDLLKQDSLYLNWNEEKKEWVLSLDDFAIEELKAIATVSLLWTQIFFYHRLLTLRFSKINSQNESLLLRHAYAQKLRKLNREWYSTKNMLFVKKASAALLRKYYGH